MKDNSKKMRHLYDEWLQSNMSRALFCRQHTINYSTFQYWIRKFRNEGRAMEKPSKNIGFSRISISASNSGTGIQPLSAIVYPSGVRLEFFSPVEASFLKSLLS